MPDKPMMYFEVAIPYEAIEQLRGYWEDEHCRPAQLLKNQLEYCEGEELCNVEDITVKRIKWPTK